MVVDGSVIEREGEEMSVSVLQNAVGGALFIESNGTHT